MDKSKPVNITLIGRSGCGKGTQAELLIKHFKNLFCIAMGDLMRDLGKQETATGTRLKKVLTEGGLPFDDLATMLWMHKISFNVTEDQGIIFDGAPRRLIEAKNIDRFLTFLDRSENTFNILIDVSREECYQRLLNRRVCSKCKRTIPGTEGYKELTHCDECGSELIRRTDDNPEAINARLDYYEERVVEVIDYYKKNGKLTVVNGEQSIFKVLEDILQQLH